MVNAAYIDYFDPPTNRNLGVVRIGAYLFENVYTVIMGNPENEEDILSLEERVEIWTEMTENYTNVHVHKLGDKSKNDYAREYDVKVFLASIGIEEEFKRERREALNNMKLYQIDTLLIPPDLKYTYFTSKDVKRLLQQGAKIDLIRQYVHDIVVQKLIEKNF